MTVSGMVSPKVSGDWLTRPETQAVLAALTAGGHQALPVGGCVRNALRGVAVADVDVATDALPERVMALARAAGLKAVPTGLAHGTVTVVSGGIAHEITTFRRDVETFGRHATVAFSDRIADDAARRDFTMNALYCRPDGALVDPLGGLPDALAGRLRFVGAPEDRIREDALRILRFFRFTAWYGDPSEGPDPEGLAACAARAEDVTGLSRERVGAEVKKLLAAADPAPAVAAMAAAGVLGRILPGADPRALAPLVHLEALAHPEVGTPPDSLRRLAALGGGDVAGRLRLSTSEARDLDALRTAIGSAETAAVLGWRLGAARARDALLLRAAVLEGPLPPGWPAEVARGAAARFPVRAADLAPLAGPALGRALQALQARWIASDLRDGQAQLLG